MVIAKNSFNEREMQMRKEIVEFVKHMRAETTLGEIQGICKGDAELCYVLDNLEKITIKKKAVMLPLRLRMQAKKAFSNDAMDGGTDITTQAIQIKLGIGYHTALAVKAWLQRKTNK